MKQIEVTEDEAAIKLCPYRERPAYNVYCVGSNCMKWAWIEWRARATSKTHTDEAGVLRVVTTKRNVPYKGICTA